MPLSNEVEKEMEKSLRMEIRGRIRKQIRRMEQTLPNIGEREQDWEQVVRHIRQSKRISVLTGAGISTMSGIPDYRSESKGFGGKNQIYWKLSINLHISQTQRNFGIVIINYLRRPCQILFQSRQMRPF
jgi:hypothetical protein